jgi:DNA-binding transcriptional MerR regulator
MKKMYSIGDLARLTGVKVPTIRYYEHNGLMLRPARTTGNQRRYDADAVQRLKFIRHSRDLGFSVDSIHQLIALNAHPEHPCADVDDIAAAHLRVVEARIESLTRLRAELTSMLAHCAGGSVGECRVIEVLADHDQCAAEHVD